MNRRRLLIVPSWYPTAGLPHSGSFFREQAQILAREWDARVLVPRGQSTRRFWSNVPLPPDKIPLQTPPAHVARYRTDRWMSWGRLYDSITGAVIRSLAAFSQEGWTPDVILAHSTAWAGLLATRAGRHVGVPAVIVEHSSSWVQNEYTDEQWAGIREALAAATTVCAVSPALRRVMLAHDLPASIHWEIVGNLVDEAVFFPARPARRADGDDFRVLTVASRNFKKDVLTLFRAAATVRTQRPDLRFGVRAVGDFRGSGPSFAELAAGCGIQDLLSTDYFLERHETAQAMRESDLFVSSSITETFGVVMVEALACGLPVVATRSGGAEYILGEGSPFLVEPRDPTTLAQAICAVADGAIPFDPEEATQSIIGRFGTEAFAARMTRVLDEAIRRPPDGEGHSPPRARDG